MVRRYRIPRNLNESSLILVTLAVASGVTVDNALECIRRHSETTLLPWWDIRELTLNSFTAMWGCVLDKEITEEQAKEIEGAAMEQYPNWQRIKEMVAREAKKGRL